MKQEPNPVRDEVEIRTPRVVAISLRPEEAVLGHCKMAISGGPGHSLCSIVFCNSIGS